MARVIAVGEPANDDERRVIAHLRDHTPDSWTVVHSIELRIQGQRFEIDVVVVAPHAVYVIDVKGTRGRISVSGPRWYPAGRAWFASPLPKLRQHARVLKTRLAAGNRSLRDLYVGQLVVLADDGAELHDPRRLDADEVCHITDLVARLKDRSAVPERFNSQSGLGRDPGLITTITGDARPADAARHLGNYELVERLTESDDGTAVYRARNLSVPGSSPQRRLQVFPLDAYQSADDRRRQLLELGNAYRTLHRLPGHPHVLTYHDFVVDEDGQRCALVLDDIAGDPLPLRLIADEALTRDEALRVLRGVTIGLDHAHRHGVAHRAFGADAVLLASDGRAVVLGFDHARSPGPREVTVVNRIPDAVDPAYLAPEGHSDVTTIGPPADVYALGVLGYRLLAGQLPFADAAEQRRVHSMLPEEPLHAAEVPEPVAAWLRVLCALDPTERPSMREALVTLDRALRLPSPSPPDDPPAGGEEDGDDSRERLRNLPRDHPITSTLTIRERLGSGAFGVVYQVHNVWARTDQVMKIVLTDPDDVATRVGQELAPLLNLPAHPNVVRVHHGELVPGTAFPYLLFEYTAGQDVGKALRDTPLPPAATRRLGIDAAAGLAHIHANGVHHCDIKPANLLLTERGAQLIDFNVAVSIEHVVADAGSSRYLPPDYAHHDPDLTDRDVYALGLTLYEALTAGGWPWEDGGRPCPGAVPRDPRTFTSLSDLSEAFVAALLRAIAPNRADRYVDASAFRAALSEARDVRRLSRPPDEAGDAPSDRDVDNAFVAHLQTLYSQSPTSNSGTRGLDRRHPVYVPTRLDTALLPDVLDGRHRVVIITGNAGDGKTAFLERLAQEAVERGATPGPARSNGSEFTLSGRRYRTNLDGSQDEGERDNDEVLAEFFGPFAGADDTDWPPDETRLIAINEGRLVDFLQAHTGRFGALRAAVEASRNGSDAAVEGVTLVNLNARSVVVGDEDSLFDGLVREMTSPRHWTACQGCVVRDRCYAVHNATTLADPDSGPRVVERLRTLYRLTHLRGRLHVTVRDLRSALAYTLTSGRGCAEIRALYRDGDPTTILQGYYFQSWSGPRGGSDRLLALLAESDVGLRGDAALDRALDFGGPRVGAPMSFSERGDYDEKLLNGMFDALPRGASSPAELAAHRAYVAAARRRFFFESADVDRWRDLLPYRGAAEFLDMLDESGSLDPTRTVVYAINRSEGLPNPRMLGEHLALAVRQVRGASIRSYRRFPLEHFIVAPEAPPVSDYVETGPERLRLSYRDPDEPDAPTAQIAIALDLYEMLWRLGRGGVPAVADLQGQHLSLTVFKNLLGSATYQSVLLTVTGHDTHHVDRGPDGVLTLRSGGEDGR